MYGRKKQEKIEPKDATSPAVLTEAVILTATINALEGRDLAAVDIAGAYLSADMENEVHVVFRGTLVKIMVADDPALYWTFFSYETGKAVLYFRLQKALYGCLKSALLFYKNLVGYIGIWVQYKSIQPMFGQQYGRRRKSNSMLARGQP